MENKSQKLTYALGTHNDDSNPEFNGMMYIVCLRCKFKSWNPYDVAHKYCPKCHVFHEDEEFDAGK